MTSSRRFVPSSPWIWHGLGFLALLAVYFAVPADSSDTDARAVVGVVVALVAVGLAGWVISRQVRFDLLGAGTSRQVRLRGLLLLLELIVIAFAVAYFMLARATDDQLVGIETRLDALYFSLTTLSTVGFGDVYAHGQVGRAVVCVQIVFDLIFVGALAGLVSRRFRGSVTGRGAPGSLPLGEDD